MTGVTGGGAVTEGARARALAVVTALLLVASLLGVVVVGRDDDGGALDLQAAAAATRATGSGRLAMNMTFAMGERTVEATGEGQFSTEPARSKLTMQSSVLPEPIEFVSDGTTAYMRAAGPYQAAAQGKPWVAFDMGRFRSPLSFDPSTTDPLQALTVLEAEGAVRNVRRDGAEEVRGVPVTRYTADVDMGHLARESDMPGKKTLASMFDDMDAALTISVGDDGVVRRSTMRVQAVIGQPMTITMTTEFFDFGTPVDIVVPPPDQVTRIASPLPTG